MLPHGGGWRKARRLPRPSAPPAARATAMASAALDTAAIKKRGRQRLQSSRK